MSVPNIPSSKRVTITNNCNQNYNLIYSSLFSEGTWKFLINKWKRERGDETSCKKRNRLKMFTKWGCICKKKFVFCDKKSQFPKYRSVTVTIVIRLHTYNIMYMNNPILYKNTTIFTWEANLTVYKSQMSFA